MVYGPGAHMGPGHTWAQLGPYGPRPIWAQGPYGPGPTGPGARALRSATVFFSQKSRPGKTDMPLLKKVTNKYFFVGLRSQVKARHWLHKILNKLHELGHDWTWLHIEQTFMYGSRGFP